jgi:hypothetical protein
LSSEALLARRGWTFRRDFRDVDAPLRKVSSPTVQPGLASPAAARVMIPLVILRIVATGSSSRLYSDGGVFRLSALDAMCRHCLVRGARAERIAVVAEARSTRRCILGVDLPPSERTPEILSGDAARERSDSRRQRDGESERVAPASAGDGSTPASDADVPSRYSGPLKFLVLSRNGSPPGFWSLKLSSFPQSERRYLKRILKNKLFQFVWVDMFKRAARRIEKKEREEALGLDEEMKEVLGLQDTDSEESESDSDSEVNSAASSEDEGASSDGASDEVNSELGLEGEDGLEEDGDSEAESNESDSTPPMSLEEALRDPIYLVSMHPEVRECIVCSGKVLKNAQMIKAHRSANVSASTHLSTTCTAQLHVYLNRLINEGFGSLSNCRNR